MLRGAGLAGVTEVVTRVTRIVTAIALARALSVTEFGIAAAILTVHELTRMFIQNGLGTRIVAASEDELPSIASTVYWMNWVLSATLFVVQIAIAVPAAHYFGADAMIAPLIVLSAVHIIYPFSMVQVYLAQRAHKWGLVLGATAVQSAADALLTALLAVLGFGLWSVVIPRIVIAAGWTVFHLYATSWTNLQPFNLKNARALSRYAAGIMGVELMASMRTHADKVIIGSILGPTALGLYAFASNIGNGITTGLSQSLGSVILPLLRHGSENGQLRHSYLRGLGLMLGMTLPLALAQAVLAPWYVPLLFGEKWVTSVPLLIVLSLASLSRPMMVATSQMLRAQHLAGEDFKLGVTVTILFFAGLFAGLSYGGLFAATVGSTAGLFAGSILAFAIGLRHTRAQTPAPASIPAAITEDTTSSAPKVSVVIACHNAADTIADTIRSVQSQTHAGWELLVIDDGSSDDSAKIVAQIANADARVHLVRQPNSGPSAARNLGVRVTRSSYVAFIDADDLWRPGHLALTVAELERDPKLGISFGGCDILSQSGAPTGRQSRLWVNGVEKRDVLASNPSCTCSSLVVRRGVFETAGMMRADMKFAEDQEWLFRVLCANWSIRSIAVHTVGYRTSPGGLSAQTEKMREGWLQFIALAKAQDPNLISHQLPRARAMMELYFVQKNIVQTGRNAAAIKQICRTVAAWPWIILHAPRRIAGVLLALLKAPSANLTFRSVESPNNV